MVEMGMVEMGMVEMWDGGRIAGGDSLVVFGDWHGNTRWARTMLERARAAAGEDVGVFYHVGDFGLWDLSARVSPYSWDAGRVEPSRGFTYLEQVDKVLGDYGKELWVVLGNHENYAEWEMMPETADGARRHPYFPNIVFLPRSFVWTDPATGMVMGCVGGAGSIDKSLREPGSSWWAEEEITLDDISAFRASVPVGGVDVFLSHDAAAGTGTVDDTHPPGYATPDVLEYCHRQRVLLRDALDAARPQVAFHGHWHTFAMNTMSGVGFTGDEYSSFIVGLGMDDSPGNGVVYDARTSALTLL